MMLKNLFGEFIERVENINISFWRGAFLLYGIIFIRTFLENYSNSLNLYHMSSFGDTFFHYPLFFLTIFLGSFIIARIITGEKIEKIAKFIVLCSFGLITPPIIDLIINKGGQIPYIFITGSYPELFKSFITYFGGGALGNGIRIELALALIGFGFYIFYKTKKLKKVLIGIILLYTTFFIMLSSPTLVFSLQNKITHEHQIMRKKSIDYFYYYKDPSNTITGNRTFVVDSVTDNNFYPPSIQKAFNQYSMTLAIIFILINAFLFFWCLFLYSSKKFFAVIKNFRYLRIMHGLILISLGIYLGIGVLGKNPIGSLFDLMSFISLISAFLFGWLFSVWENDEVDVEIDKISNKERPLAKTELQISPEEWKNLKYVFLSFSLGFAFLAGLYSFIFILMFIFIYHIYSAPPFRFKNIPGISSFLIGVIFLLLAWMGFFMTAGTENLSAFPAKYVFGILAIFILVENAKNIKDIEGDRKEGIKTLPVILGGKWGKLVSGLGLFLGSVLVPFVFYLNRYTLCAGIFFGLVLFFLTIRKNYKEKYSFITYFIYVIVFFILMHL